jgi:hypothetical protein
MPLIPAGEHARLLTSMLSSRTATAESRQCRRTETKTAAMPDARWLAAAADAARGDRRPVHQFSGHPLSLSQVRAIVTGAYATERRDWGLTALGDPKLVILLTAYRVTRLRRGMHLVEPPGQGRFAALPDAAWLPELRREYADAPALLHICGDLEAARQMGGGPGYGALLVRAGALGHAVWLSAVSAGLVGATYGRASHHVTDAARLADGGLRHLMTVAIGTAPTAASDTDTTDEEGSQADSGVAAVPHGLTRDAPASVRIALTPYGRG